MLDSIWKFIWVQLSDFCLLLANKKKKALFHRSYPAGAHGVKVWIRHSSMQTSLSPAQRERLVLIHDRVLPSARLVHLKGRGDRNSMLQEIEGSCLAVVCFGDFFPPSLPILFFSSAISCFCLFFVGKWEGGIRRHDPKTVSQSLKQADTNSVVCSCPHKGPSVGSL